MDKTLNAEITQNQTVVKPYPWTVTLFPYADWDSLQDIYVQVLQNLC